MTVRETWLRDADHLLRTAEHNIVSPSDLLRLLQRAVDLIANSDAGPQPAPLSDDAFAEAIDRSFRRG